MTLILWKVSENEPAVPSFLLVLRIAGSERKGELLEISFDLRGRGGKCTSRTTNVKCSKKHQVALALEVWNLDANEGTTFRVM
jgi:hypothetical protein